MDILNPISPAYKYIKYAEKINKEKGHENLGFLSLKRGFMPTIEPLKKLPYPFSQWDDIAKEMPFHYKNQSLRIALKKLPILDANESVLPDKYLCRASMLLSMLAHAYVRNERDEDLDIPAAIIKPWETVTKRLKRPKPFLSYIDLIIYNWKYKNSEGPCELENLELLTPTVNNQEENIFYLTQTEIAFKTKEVVNYVIQIQNAIVNNKKQKVIQGLKKLKEVVSNVTESSFLKINPNPRSATYVDPVVWAKTVAPFAVPLKEGVQGPSGTSSPFFHLIDTFIERNKYDTILGKEALFIREWYPEHWRNFINAVDEVSITEYIKKCDDETLDGAFYDFVETYSGDKGFLGVHRRKVYGYLQMAFKVGRSVTIGGFSGLFKERTWEEVDDELETTRLERYAKKQLKCPYSGVISQTTIGSNKAKNVVLDTKNKGISYRPGDRCSVVPKNTIDVVSELLELMDLTGNEFVVLNDTWRNYFKEFYNENIKQTTIRKILASAKLGDASEALKICEHIKHFMKIEADGKLPLKNLVDQLLQFNMDAKKFLIPYMASILKPEEERMYSISSGFDEDQLELTVGDATTVIGDKKYKGVASSYLHSSEMNKDSQIPIKIIRPLRFSLPEEQGVPIFLFAGGSGIAPFKGFWEALEKKEELTNLTVFYSVKYEKNIVFKKQLEQVLLGGKANVNIILTRESKQLDKEESLKNGKLIFKATDSKKINDLILETENSERIFGAIKPQFSENKKGYFYSCGKAGFALSVLDSLKGVIAKNSVNTNETQETFYHLFSEDRLMQDVFTSPTQVCNAYKKEFDLSEVIDHNSPEKGYWMVINGKVYDLTEFKEIHPGGDKIVEDNAGRDATHEFERANHHRSKEITSMLSMYCIGNLKKIAFSSDRLQIQYQDWVNSLHLVTEMQNTFIADFSFENKKVTRLCEEKEITPYKLALKVENQQRFQHEYVKNIKQIFKDLFYDSPSYELILSEFKEVLVEEIDLNLKNVTYKASEFKYRWEELGELEQKNRGLISLVRKLLWEGVKLFEAYHVDSTIEFDQAIEIVLNDCLIALEKINQSRKVFENIYS